MNTLKLELENCYGIQKMQQDIDFSKNNVVVIYAPNGTMKSSFAKTFEAIRDGKTVKEKIYGCKSKYTVTDESAIEIKPESIMVINPFDENAYENQGTLMANEALRKQYIQIYKSIEQSRETLFQKIKVKLKYSSRSNFDAERSMLGDWGYTKKDLFLCLKNIADKLSDSDLQCALKEEELDYNTLFNEKVYTMVTSGKTYELIEEYEKKYSELLEKSLYMQKGVIDHNNYANISDSLSSNGFFGVKNEIRLVAKDGSTSVTIKTKDGLNELIKKEKEQVLNTKELRDLFEKINKAISKNKDTQALNAYLQQHPDIVAEYRDIDKFKRKIWVKVFGIYQTELRILLDNYDKAQNDLKQLRDKAKSETTDWSRALDLFKKRFFVPFSIEPANQEDVILNLDMPSFKYIFHDDRGFKEVPKEDLLDVLSTGERRAYYILNLIFQILVAQKEGREKLIILDDISESFDYKNKHAIIEYISDIADYTNIQGKKLFRVILLTHNFDFYRTVASRITKRGNSYIAYTDNGKINFEKGQYIGNLFQYYKDKIAKGNNDNIVVASIPFVRNLIEYTEGTENPEYIKLTSLLHYKKDTRIIELGDIEKIYNQYWCKSPNVNFAKGRETTHIYDIIISEADAIVPIEKLEIENKLILSMAIRLKSDEYMIQKISNKVENGESVIRDIYTKNNQSAWLYKEYKKSINDDVVEILEQVAMLTPENIHLNSFMFEPILDMSLLHLYDLYRDVKNLLT